MPKRAKTEPEVMVVDLRAKLKAKKEAKTEPVESGHAPEAGTARLTRSRGRKVGLEAAVLAGHEAFDQVGLFCVILMGGGGGGV